jgi:hypothetical protein
LIRAYIDEHIANAPADRYMKHVCTNPLIRLTNTDSADADIDFVVYVAYGDGPWGILTIGRYFNKVVRAKDQWYFLENLVTH